MKRELIGSIFLSGLLFYSLLVSVIADELPPDVENTGAFMVELKAGASSTVRRSVRDDWDLVPLESADVRGPGDTGDWFYLAPREGTATRSAAVLRKNENPWDDAYDLYGGKMPGSNTRDSRKTPLGKRAIKPQQIGFIEPDLSYKSPLTKRDATEPSGESPAPGATTIAGASQTKHWPQFENPGSFLEARFSQLKEARELVEAKVEQSHSSPVRVAFLDTGYDRDHITRPPNVNVQLGRNFFEDQRTTNGTPLENNPGPKGSQSHGTGTIGIFGGGKVVITSSDGQIIFSGVLGGAPMVEVIPMRVANSVVHFENPFFEIRPSGTTRAIRYAIKQKCDVISMSHGGLPSRSLARAINAAYENGIAMFFASGDYLRPPNSPLQTPRYVVFPAAFSRAMSVCGVTADYKTYGEPPGDFNSANGPVSSWTLRGNWGPTAWMKNSIAAFSPNIPWAHQPNPKKHEKREDVIDLDGQGTSSSTPQAAAAGALWLQYYRDDSGLKQVWNKWQKAESVYQALKTSARRVPDSKYCNQYFGSGILQAKEALTKKPSDLPLEKQKEAKVNLGWIRLLGSVIPTGIRRDDLSTSKAMDAMLDLEIQQLASRSVRLQEIIEKYAEYIPHEDESIPPTVDTATFRKEFFSAVKEDPKCSRRLASIIGRALAEPTPSN